MAAYTRQGDMVSLLLSKAEATALRDLANYAQDATAEHSENGMTKHAAERAVKALNQSVDTACRSGARIDYP